MASASLARSSSSRVRAISASTVRPFSETSATPPVTMIFSCLFAIRPLRCFGGELFALLDRLFDGADHVEGGFRQMIVLAFADGAETLDGVGKVDEFSGRAGEDFSDVERLRQEALDLAG